MTSGLLRLRLFLVPWRPGHPSEERSRPSLPGRSSTRSATVARVAAIRGAGARAPKSAGISAAEAGRTSDHHARRPLIRPWRKAVTRAFGPLLCARLSLAGERFAASRARGAGPGERRRGATAHSAVAQRDGRAATGRAGRVTRKTLLPLRPRAGAGQRRRRSVRRLTAAALASQGRLSLDSHPRRSDQPVALGHDLTLHALLHEESFAPSSRSMTSRSMHGGEAGRGGRRRGTGHRDDASASSGSLRSSPAGARAEERPITEKSRRARPARPRRRAPRAARAPRPAARSPRGAG